MRGPHEHLCPECQCHWPCSNEMCQDLDGKWCDNVCGGCEKQPEYLASRDRLQDAREHARYASHLCEEAGELDLSKLCLNVAEMLQERAQERSKGVR